MYFYYIDEPYRKVHEEASNFEIRARAEYCAVTDPAHKKKS